MVDQLIVFLLIFVRVMAVLLTIPLFSNRSMPNLAKIGFGGILALMLLNTNAVDATMLVPYNPLVLAVAIAHEILLGVLIGFVVNLTFTAVTVATRMMGLQIGFRAANLFDPLTNASSSVLDQYYSIVVLALFMALNGHHMLIRVLAHTFDSVPLGSFAFTGVDAYLLTDFVTQAFVAGTQLAIPVVGSLLMTDVGLGLIARTVPQIQIFFLSLPLKIGLGLLILGLTATITIPVIRGLFDDMIINILAITG